MGKGNSDPHHLEPSRSRRRPYPRHSNPDLLLMLVEYRVWCSMLITILVELHAATSANNSASAVDQLIRIEHHLENPSQTGSYAGVR